MVPIFNTYFKNDFIQIYDVVSSNDFTERK